VAKNVVLESKAELQRQANHQARAGGTESATFGMRKQDDTEIVLASLQVHRREVSDPGFGKNPFEFAKRSTGRNWNRLGHLRNIVSSKDSTLPICKFGNVLTGAGALKLFNEPRWEVLLHRRQHTTPTFADDDGGAVDRQCASQASERCLHVGHEIFGEEQATRIRSKG